MGSHLNPWLLRALMISMMCSLYLPENTIWLAIEYNFFVIMSKLKLNWAINCPHFLVILTNYLNFPRFVNGKPVNIPGHSVPLAGLGGFILVFGFLAFNGGSQVSFEFNFDCHQFMWRAAYLKMETVALSPWQSWTQSWEARPEALLCSSLPSSSGLPRTL